jgi:NADP-dependent 3-hydroxy acid dehydrogenase YdfG
VLITRSSFGIGLELARELAPRARALVLVARRAERLESSKTSPRPNTLIYCAGPFTAKRALQNRVVGKVKTWLRNTLAVNCGK